MTTEESEDQERASHVIDALDNIAAELERLRVLMEY
jgi:hypothetical protein